MQFRTLCFLILYLKQLFDTLLIATETSFLANGAVFPVRNKWEKRKVSDYPVVAKGTIQSICYIAGIDQHFLVQRVKSISLDQPFNKQIQCGEALVRRCRNSASDPLTGQVIDHSIQRKRIPSKDGKKKESNPVRRDY
ncbi:hypothetical protein C4D60_Mb00t16920 [Musa balbisiana]|uniref:Uncharacterized protein n=1 Tax=Musa balbisiana TaxID=52838 RepID=A0A4S8I243_MUSBA|nr:hypothetical protein C4D60_Mb00t16920 [Musa balbisiana]